MRPGSAFLRDLDSDADLLKKVLKSPEPKARAAATRVLAYWRDRVSEPLELLRTQVNDENGAVRLQAVWALSFFAGADAAKASEVVVESLIQLGLCRKCDKAGSNANKQFWFHDIKYTSHFVLISIKKGLIGALTAKYVDLP